MELSDSVYTNKSLNLKRVFIQALFVDNFCSQSCQIILRFELYCVSVHYVSKLFVVLYNE